MKKKYVKLSGGALFKSIYNDPVKRKQNKQSVSEMVTRISKCDKDFEKYDRQIKQGREKSKDYTKIIPLRDWKYETNGEVVSVYKLKNSLKRKVYISRIKYPWGIRYVNNSNYERIILNVKAASKSVSGLEIFQIERNNSKTDNKVLFYETVMNKKNDVYFKDQYFVTKNPEDFKKIQEIKRQKKLKGE